MRFFRLYAVLLVTLLVSACATGPKFSETQSAMPTLKADQGRIYFYRTASMFGAAIQPTIQLNGEAVGDSKPGGYFFVDQVSGAKEVSTTTEVEKKLSFTLDAGQTRYVRTAIGLGLVVGRVYPELVDDATAQKEISDTSYIGKPLSGTRDTTNYETNGAKIDRVSQSTKRADPQFPPVSGRQLVGNELSGHFTSLGSVTGNWRSGSGLRLNVRSDGKFWVGNSNPNSMGTDGTYSIHNDANQICLSVRKQDWKKMELCYEIFDLGNGRFRMQSVTNNYNFSYVKS